MKIRGRVHPAGAAMMAAAFLFADSRTVLSALCALLWHEGAHLAAMALCGVKSCLVELTPFGGMADAEEYHRLSPFRQAVIAIAGVGASGFGAALCLYLLPKTPFVYSLLKANLALALLNVLPVWPLDGARTMVALLEAAGLGRSCQKLLAGLGYVLGALLVALGLYGAWHGVFNPGLLLMGPYLWHAARWGDVSERLRRVGERYNPLQERPLLPVQGYACETGREHQALAMLAGERQSGRYPVLMAVDGKTGAIRQILTQGQFHQALFAQEPMADIGCSRNVDKGPGI